MNQPVNLDDLAKHAHSTAALLKAMANPHRLMLLCLLNNGEHTVSELNATLALPQSSLSQHLAVLREAGLVSTRRKAQMIYYSLASEDVEVIIGTLYQLYCAPQTNNTV